MSETSKSGHRKILRHTWGLRDALFQEWEGLRNGTVPPERALASAKLAQVILKSVEVEMAYVRQCNETREGQRYPISTEVRLGPP